MCHGGISDTLVLRSQWSCNQHGLWLRRAVLLCNRIHWVWYIHLLPTLWYYLMGVLHWLVVLDIIYTALGVAVVAGVAGGTQSPLP